jgi:hypothetical protein
MFKKQSTIDDVQFYNEQSLPFHVGECDIECEECIITWELEVADKDGVIVFMPPKINDVSMLILYRTSFDINDFTVKHEYEHDLEAGMLTLYEITGVVVDFKKMELIVQFNVG